MRISVVFFVMLLVLPLAGCNTPIHHGELSFGDTPVPTGDYGSVLNRWTQNDKTYNGGAEAVQITATLLSREVVEQQVYLDAERFHWTPEKYRDSRQQALYGNESATRVFLSVYTNNADSNNLDKSSSVWNIFLDVNGKRLLPSSIVRSHENRADMVDKFPYLNVWTTNYYVTFPNPTSDSTSGRADLTVAGTLGAIHLSFPK